MNIAKAFERINSTKKQLWIDKYLKEKSIPVMDFDRNLFIEWLTDEFFKHLNTTQK